MKLFTIWITLLSRYVPVYPICVKLYQIWLECITFKFKMLVILELVWWLKSFHILRSLSMNYNFKIMKKRKKNNILFELRVKNAWYVDK